MRNESFTYCTGYECAKKQECLRWKKHKELLNKKIDTREKNYIKPESCVQYNYTNFMSISVFG